MKIIPAVLSIAVLAGGCVSAPCDKPQEYQRVRPQATLRVPDGLSEPPLRSRAPEVTGTQAQRRADGRCLEEPPVYVPPSGEDEQDDG